MRSKAWLWRLTTVITVIAALLIVIPAQAAEIVNTEEVYRLAAGQEIDDDLIVTAQEIYIDGTVRGDLLAVGGFVEINGTVEGDLLALAAEVRINGTVADDVRTLSAGLIINGKVGDALLAGAGGGQSGAAGFASFDGRSIQQGVEIGRDATIGGDMIIGAGSVMLAGTIAEDLLVGTNLMDLRGSVAGDARLIADRLELVDTARVAGQLTYSTPAEMSIPAQVAGSVRFEPQPIPEVSPGPTLLDYTVRLLLILAGCLLLGWLLLRFSPRTLERPADAITEHPGRALLYGLVATLLLFIVPIISGLIIAAVIFFWGWLPGIMLMLFLTAALVLAWTLSPLITGLWLGQTIFRSLDRPVNRMVALLLGVAAIVLFSFIPTIGWLIYLASFLFALGGSLMVGRSTLTWRPGPMVATPA